MWSPITNMRDTHLSGHFKNAQYALRTAQAEPNNFGMSVGANIRARRKAKGWTILELANKVDSDVGNISRLERNLQGYSDDLLRRIAKALECAVADLFIDSLVIEDEAHAATLTKPEKLTGARVVWVIGNGQGGTPDRIWDDGGYPVGASDEYVLVSTDDEHAFAVRVRGDSMAPRYMPGEFALVEPSTPAEIEDDVLVRLATGETMLKRLLSRRAGVRLGSYNSPEVMTFDPEQITWIYHVSHTIPARKVKHWVRQDDGSQTDIHDVDLIVGYTATGSPEVFITAKKPARRLPEPRHETEHVFGPEENSERDKQ